MGEYRIKPEDVQAEKFTGSNWHVIERWLGPHLTKTKERSGDPTDVVHSVFDVDTKVWMIVSPGFYVVRDKHGALEVLRADVFESRWEPKPVVQDFIYPNVYPNTNPPFSPPYTARFGNGGAIRD